MKPTVVVEPDSLATPPFCPHKIGDMSPTFNAIGLAAADMATSLAFYRRLGLVIKDRPAGRRPP